MGLRCPDHPVASAVLRSLAQRSIHGVAAPSANRFGRVSPTLASHVAAEFGPELMILDGGACREGIESAIVDCSRPTPYLLRPGTVSREALQAALGVPLLDPDRASPRVSVVTPWTIARPNRSWTSTGASATARPTESRTRTRTSTGKGVGIGVASPGIDGSPRSTPATAASCDVTPPPVMRTAPTTPKRRTTPRATTSNRVTSVCPYRTRLQ